MSNSDPNMTVPGGRWKIIGNNPLAYAIPAGREPPLLLDMALSAVAAGKVDAAREAGKKVPGHWLVDARGRPTADPALYPLKACLVPMAGHKGYGLALLVETLAGVLSGAEVLGRVGSWVLDDPRRGTGHGHAFAAVNIAVLMPVRTFKARVDRLIREIRGAPKSEGSGRIWLPGEREGERREAALQHGIPLPPDVRASLRGLAADVDLSADWLPA